MSDLTPPGIKIMDPASLDMPDIKQPEITERDKQRYDFAKTASKVSGVNFDTIYDDPEAFLHVWNDEPEDKPIKRQGRFNRSDIGTGIDLSGALKKMSGTLSDSAQDYNLFSQFGENPSSELMEQIDTFMAQKKDYKKDAPFLMRSMLGVVEQIPLWTGSLAQGADEALAYGLGFGATAAIAGQAGPQIALPEEVITVPIATALGFKYGFTVGGFEAYRKFARGMNYYNLLKWEDENGNKMDPELAWVMADIMGSAESALELMQVGEVATGGVAKRILKGKVNQAMVKLAKSPAFNNILAKAIGRAAVSAGTESLEEAIQEVSNVAGEFLAKEINNAKEGTELVQATPKEDIDRIVSAFTDSLSTFGLMSLARVPASIKKMAEAKTLGKGTNKVIDSATDKEMAADQKTEEKKTDWSEKVNKAFNFDDEKGKAAKEYIERIAKAQGITGDEFMGRYVADVVNEDYIKNLPEEDKILYQYAGLKGVMNETDKENLKTAIRMEWNPEKIEGYPSITFEDYKKFLDIEGKEAEESYETYKKESINNLIRLTTGWFRGKYDNQWRKETDDSQIKLKNTFDTSKAINQGVVGDVIDYPELFKIYPEMKDIPITINVSSDIKEGASFKPGENEDIVVNVNAPDRIVPELVHELQHAIQEKEGFAKGGSPEIFMEERKEKMESLLKDIREINHELSSLAKKIDKAKTKEERAELNKKYDSFIDKRNNLNSDYSKLENNERDIFEKYKRIAGEIEARDIQGRLNDRDELRRRNFNEARKLAIEKREILKAFDHNKNEWKGSPEQQKIIENNKRLNDMGYGEKLPSYMWDALLEGRIMGVTSPPYSTESFKRENAILFQAEKEQKEINVIRNKYQNTDKWLKAPNGNNTKLSEYQWLQVRTPEFKTWFGDWENDPESASKVVDENGEPLVVYHGRESIKNLTIFNVSERKGYGRTQIGVYFTDDRNYAESYTSNNPTQVVPAFINISNPYMASEYGEITMVAENEKESFEKKGFDGIIYKDKDFSPYSSDVGEYLIFNPKQIKSATDNSGKFDPDNPNIFMQPQNTEGYKAAVEFLDDGRAIIRATNAADFSSFVHELGHIIRRQLSSEDLEVLEKWLGIENGVWEREHEEEFADAFEQYSERGIAPTSRLQPIFDKIKEWLKNIYDRFDKKKLPDDVIAVFDNLFRTPEERKIESEIKVIDGQYRQELANSKNLLKDYESYIGPEIDEMEKKAETVRKVIKRLEEELGKIEKIRKEADGLGLIDIKTLDDFWEKWQEDLESEEWFQKKQELENYFTDLIPDTWEKLEPIIRQWSPSGMGKKASLRKTIDNLLPMWKSAVLNKGSFTEKHKHWLLSHVKNHPDYFIENYLALTPGIGEEEIQAYDEWKALQQKEEEEQKLAQKEAEKQKYIKQQEETSELKRKLAEVATMRDRLELAEEFSDPLTKLRILTGEYTVGEILSGEDETALGYYYETGKKIPAALKKAQTEAKKEGIQQERQRKKALEDNQREKKKTRKYIEKLARRISRPPSSTIDFYYKEAIEALQNGIDPNFRSKKTLNRKEKFQEFLQSYPEKEGDIPVKVKSFMLKKSLNEMTLDELETLDKTIQQLRKTGRTKRLLKLTQEKRNFERIKDKTINPILNGQGITNKPGKGKATRNEGKYKNIPQNVRAWTLRPQRLFDILDGGAGFKGENFNFFVNNANKILDEEYRKTDIRRENGEKKAKELGININKLGKIIRIDGVSYTKDEILDIYAGMKNPLKKEAIIYGNNLSETLAEKFISTLSEKEKRWADYIIQDYEDNYNRLRTAHVEYTNEDLGKEVNYTPIQRLDADYDGMQISLAQELLERQGMKKAYAERGFTKSRIKIGKEHHKEIRLGLTSMWTGQVQRQEHYIAGAATIKQMQKMANNSEYTAAVRQKYGSETVKVVQDYVNRVANPDIYKSPDGLARVSRVLRQNTAVGYLAFNMVTMAKQLPSLALYLPEAGPSHLVKSAASMLVHPIKMMKRAEELDPQVKHRSIDRFSEELKEADRNTYDKIIKKIGQKGMVGIYALDKLAVTIGWNAVYEKSLAKGMSETEAALEAKNATLRTQPAGHAKDIARIYANNEVLNWALMFTNQVNQIYNMISYDTGMRAKLAWKEKDFSEAYHAALTVGGVGISAMLIWMLSNKRPPEDEEDVAEALSDAFIGCIPLIGKEIVAARKGWFMDDDIAAVKAVKGISTGDTRKIIEGVAITTGLPYIAGKRTLKAVEEQDFWELLGGAP